MANSNFPAGSELDINIGWISGNGQTILRLQQDRNLVLYKSGSRAYQAPNAFGNGNTAIMQNDGNFVLYDVNNKPVWASNTAGNPGKHSSLKERAGVKPEMSWGYACGLLFLGRRDWRSLFP
jgi:hypothetical protein